MSFFLLALALAAALVIYLALFHNYTVLRVVSMNVWGMPGGMGGCKNKEARIQALARVMVKGDFDLFLIQERTDLCYSTIYYYINKFTICNISF